MKKKFITNCKKRQKKWKKIMGPPGKIRQISRANLRIAIFFFSFEKLKNAKKLKVVKKVKKSEKKARKFSELFAVQNWKSVLRFFWIESRVRLFAQSVFWSERIFFFHFFSLFFHFFCVFFTFFAFFYTFKKKHVFYRFLKKLKLTPGKIRTGPVFFHFFMRFGGVFRRFF